MRRGAGGRWRRRQDNQGRREEREEIGVRRREKEMKPGGTEELGTERRQLLRAWW
jgi:hypothetical protein